MAKNDKDTLYVIAAAYEGVDAAVADYEAVKELYRLVKSSNDFDAAVIGKDDDGKVHIVKKHEQPTRHGAAVGLGWGLAVGVVATLFPPVGIGIVTAGGAGAAIGGVTGHASGGMSRERPQGARGRPRRRPGRPDRGLRDQPGRPGRRQHQGCQPRHLAGHRHGRRPTRGGHEEGRAGGGDPPAEDRAGGDASGYEHHGS